MKMAYMTAWTHVKTLNRRFRSPAVVSQRGDETGGGAVLISRGFTAGFFRSKGGSDL